MRPPRSCSECQSSRPQRTWHSATRPRQVTPTLAYLPPHACPQPYLTLNNLACSRNASRPFERCRTRPHRRDKCIHSQRQISTQNCMRLYTRELLRVHVPTHPSTILDTVKKPTKHKNHKHNKGNRNQNKNADDNQTKRKLLTTTLETPITREWPRCSPGAPRLDGRAGDHAPIKPHQPRNQLANQ